MGLCREPGYAQHPRNPRRNILTLKHRHYRQGLQSATGKETGNIKKKELNHHIIIRQSKHYSCPVIISV
jgi:hypothetical protein